MFIKICAFAPHELEGDAWFHNVPKVSLLREMVMSALLIVKLVSKIMSQRTMEQTIKQWYAIKFCAKLSKNYMDNKQDPASLWKLCFIVFASFKVVENV